MAHRIFVAALLAVGVLAVAVSAAPAVSAESDTYNFGVALAGTLVTHRFVISNIGDQPLQNLRARSACGCTLTTLPVDTLAPGESVGVEVTFDTAEYGGRSVTKQVYIESNDPVTPTLFLYLIGEVRVLPAYNVTITDMQYPFYILIDLRSPAAYAERHIVGAVNLPYEEFAASMLLLPAQGLLIVYDEDGTRGDEVAQMLIRNGYLYAKSLAGGFSMWVTQMGASFLWPLGQ
jgi:rhodanese-related sulfurtransferase